MLKTIKTTNNMSMPRMKRKYFLTTVFVISSILCFWTSMGIIRGNNKQTIQIPLKSKMCYVNVSDRRLPSSTYNNTDMTMIYFVTPTYPRPAQVPELVRLGHTLMHVPRVHWIVADDEPLCSDEVLTTIRRTGLPITHISSPKPFSSHKSRYYPRGVSNRRAAIDWVRKNVREGILYFGDDDNTFDLRLFDVIRSTNRVSMFPVGLIGEYGVSSPVVKNGKVVGFFDSWPSSRVFPVDMAGFAVNVKLLKPSTTMPYHAGMEENKFLLSLGIKVEDIEPLADNCSKVYVWHTKTARSKKSTLRINLEKLEKVSKLDGFVDLLKEVVSLGMATFFPDNGSVARITRNGKSYDVMNGIK